jgi:hypothetical protein
MATSSPPWVSKVRSPCTLVGLIGISNGTYFGFNFPEQKTP